MLSVANVASARTPLHGHSPPKLLLSAVFAQTPTAAQREVFDSNVRRHRHGAGCLKQPCHQGFCDISDPPASGVDSLTQVCAVLGVLVHLVSSSCPRDILAVYKIRLETFWSEERFPKQYPQWRPPAQWSKTVGFTHPAEFQLYEVRWH